MAAVLRPVKAAVNRVHGAFSLELQNEGSVARDHLASERTFLAWLRTSLSLVSIGIAVTQLFQLPSLVGSTDERRPEAANYLDFQRDAVVDWSEAAPHVLLSRRLDSIAKLGKPLGGSFILLGVISLGLGCYRYFAVQATLVRGKFIPSRVGSKLLVRQSSLDHLPLAPEFESLTSNRLSYISTHSFDHCLPCWSTGGRSDCRDTGWETHLLNAAASHTVRYHRRIPEIVTTYQARIQFTRIISLRAKVCDQNTHQLKRHCDGLNWYIILA